MENKYFTPDIENIYIGYELEWKCKIRNQDWKKTTCDTDLISIIYDEYEHADFEEPYNEQFRVPYITKEQIEAEGWEEMNAPIMSIGHGFLYIPFLKNNCRLDYNYTTNILNIKRDDVTNLYYGECKDINTFRKIIKLLGI